jgi:hypothetical protein
MKKLSIFVLTSSVLIGSCADMSTMEQATGGFGALIGGVIGEKTANKLGVQDSTLRTSIIATGGIAGAAVGIVIGQKLAKYFGEHDKQNLETTLNDTQSNQPVAWCSDKGNDANKSAQPNKNVAAVQCGTANKIVETPSSPVQTSSGEMCRKSKTDVLGANGQYETIDTTFCKTASGGWSEKVA